MTWKLDGNTRAPKRAIKYKYQKRVCRRIFCVPKDDVENTKLKMLANGWEYLGKTRTGLNYTLKFYHYVTA